MSINKKTKELLNEIKNSKEYFEYEQAKKDLLKYPNEGIILEEYKQILFENQIEHLLEGTLNYNKNDKMEKVYKELSKYEVVNRYLIAEYRFKNILTNILKDLNNIIGHNEENENSFFVS